MFGVYYPAQSYPAEGPAATIEFIALDICETESRLLIPERRSVSIMPYRTSDTVMPSRESDRFCPDHES